MTQQILIFLACLLIAASSFATETARFFSALPDVPVMPGLSELTEQTASFDKPEGRIVESIALIESGDENSIAQFYEQTLPQFGWSRVSAQNYRRENENLRLSFENSQGRKFMRLMVAPAEEVP
ncbi:MAG: hypothetical protein IT558_01790 [Alphaproteobacteria bacterium]|nr:hypothetical protein [Alphaproteobacteria bacterium]